MRRHISMEQLARDVLSDAVSAAQTKTASVSPSLKTELGALLTKVAAELRSVPGDSLTYADVRSVAEVRLGKR